jgi:hypothetical protein
LTLPTDTTSQFTILEGSGQPIYKETLSRNNIQVQIKPAIAIVPKNINSSISKSNIILESRQYTSRQEIYFANLEQP